MHTLHTLLVTMCRPLRVQSTARCPTLFTHCTEGNVCLPTDCAFTFHCAGRQLQTLFKTGQHNETEIFVENCAKMLYSGFTVGRIVASYSHRATLFWSFPPTLLNHFNQGGARPKSKSKKRKSRP